MISTKYPIASGQFDQPTSHFRIAHNPVESNVKAALGVPKIPFAADSCRLSW